MSDGPIPGALIRVGLLVLFASQLSAQLVVKLSPATVSAFDRYAQGVESQLNDRWQGKKAFLALDENTAEKQRVLNGEISIQQMNHGQPVPIENGLIHDWTGAAYIPHVSIERVVQILEEFDHHKDIFPEVSESHTVSRSGDHVTGTWELKQKSVVPVILDVREDVSFEAVSPGKWKGAAYARDITEVDTGLLSRGKKFPAGQGHGYLWRLYAYWSLQSDNGGVWAECRTLSLSRDIPSGLNWAVGPFVQKQPHDSLNSTLSSLRKAAGK